ncbi:transcription factor bHLH100-like [Durio zibethinus]|uniref:Transcription factor bHLH100-like n=1 Tax=Durio zibethinus TaxID=66656 RepID=A0A6P6AM93_DURZI|nr:transcription factor bHLH100-like [Durio zibethinus]
MCTLSPLFPVCDWRFDAPISHEQLSYTFADAESFEEFLDHFTPTLQEIQLDRSLSFMGHSGNNPTIDKKLNHNASERDRRRKINRLYSSLRSLLPVSEQTKRLSIPATVSRVLKYIPELQAQVETLGQKKEEILSRIPTQDEFVHKQNITKLERLTTTSPLAISVSRVSETEVVVQISTFRAYETPLSAVLPNLEEDGLFLTDASCFESFGGRVFYNLNFQVERTNNLEAVGLNEKLLSLYRRRKCSWP